MYFIKLRTSNETPNIPVYFDNLQVSHVRGKLLETSEYYPYGLGMKNISYKAAGSLQNRYKYNAGNEYEDEGELNYSNTFYRKYDAQIGRFTGVDMLAEDFADLNPYQYGADNPVMFNDPMGDLYGRMQKGEDGNYHQDWFNNFMWGSGASGTYEGYGSGGGSGGGWGSGSGYFANDVMNAFWHAKDGSTPVMRHGEFGYWTKNTYDPSGYKADQYEGSLETVVVGSNSHWVSLGGGDRNGKIGTEIWQKFWEGNSNRITLSIESKEAIFRIAKSGNAKMIDRQDVKNGANSYLEKVRYSFGNNPDLMYNGKQLLTIGTITYNCQGTPIGFNAARLVYPGMFCDQSNGRSRMMCSDIADGEWRNHVKYDGWEGWNPNAMDNYIYIR